MPHECTNCGRTFPDGSKEMLSGCPDCGGNKFQFDPSEPASAPSSGGTADATAAAAELRRDDADRTRPNEDDRTGTGDRPTDDTDGTADGVDRIDTGTDDVDRIDIGTGDGTDADGDESDGSHEWPEVGTREGLEAQRKARDASRGEPGEWPDHFEEPNADSDDTHVDESEDVEVTHSTEPRPSTPDPEDVEVTHANEAASDAEATASTGSKVDVVDDAADFSDDRVEEDSAQASARRDVVSLGELTGSPGLERDDEPDEPEPRQRPDIAALREELNQQFESIRIVDRGTYELNLMSLYDREEYIIQLQEDGKYIIEVPDAWDHGPDE